ncbi:MAG: hypothetical protein M1533_00080 [Candidatus Thermoplasmatota archaeon]|jgi:5S rRNA maturation endonuclease (ribonuclease M5)|nr:hypothetical protein [Candidatus Thermoplasmatota archaeon]
MHGGSERLLAFIERYIEKNLTVPIIVEGTNDAKSLRRMGFSGPIIKMNQGRTLMALAEAISGDFDEVILLTDFDSKGDKLAATMQEYLVSLGTRVDRRLREGLNSCLPVKTVEEIPAAVERLARVSPKSRNIIKAGRNARFVTDHKSGE